MLVDWSIVLSLRLLTTFSLKLSPCVNIMSNPPPRIDDGQRADLITDDEWADSTVTSNDGPTSKAIGRDVLVSYDQVSHRADRSKGWRREKASECDKGVEKTRHSVGGVGWLDVLGGVRDGLYLYSSLRYCVKPKFASVTKNLAARQNSRQIMIGAPATWRCNPFSDRHRQQAGKKESKDCRWEQIVAEDGITRLVIFLLKSNYY